MEVGAGFDTGMREDGAEGLEVDVRDVAASDDADGFHGVLHWV